MQPFQVGLLQIMQHQPVFGIDCAGRKHRVPDIEATDQFMRLDPETSLHKRAARVLGMLWWAGDLSVDAGLVPASAGDVEAVIRKAELFLKILHDFSSLGAAMRTVMTKAFLDQEVSTNQRLSARCQFANAVFSVLPAPDERD